MDTLTYLGEAETAYSLLLSHGYPSWLYSVDQGATTVWERWNSYTLKDGFGPVGMNSFNHYAYGAIVNWMFRTMAGIGQLPQESGFRKFLLAPIPDRRMGMSRPPTGRHMASSAAPGGMTNPAPGLGITRSRPGRRLT